MSRIYKPEGYPSVSSYLMADGAGRVIAFLEKALGGVVLRRFEKPDGSIAHAEVRIDDSVVMLSDGTETHPAFPAWIHVYVADVDEAYRAAIAAGGTPVMEPTQQPGDPDRRGAVLDPAGNTWWISSQVGEG